MPLFQSFDDALRWFLEGGAVEPLAERRERFTAGRAQFLSFQAPVSETAIADAVLDAQDQIADFDGVELMPLDLLHISIRGAGFQVIARTRPDDVLREEVPVIAARAGKIISNTPPIEIMAGPVNVFPDAVILEVHDGGALGELRAKLDVLEREDALGYEATEYLPHITIATFRDASPAAVLRARLPLLRELPPLRATLRRIELARWWFTGVDPDEEPERDVVQSYLLRG
ncbi:MAG: 2'-5' RNA ligase family protein [Chloroflexota bacterium]|nr:2'-5' RNA ligase family protein [Chloroflexota bacterium]